MNFCRKWKIENHTDELRMFFNFYIALHLYNFAPGLPKDIFWKLRRMLHPSDDVAAKIIFRNKV